MAAGVKNIWRRLNGVGSKEVLTITLSLPLTLPLTLTLPLPLLLTLPYPGSRDSRGKKRGTEGISLIESSLYPFVNFNLYRFVNQFPLFLPLPPPFSLSLPFPTPFSLSQPLSPFAYPLSLYLFRGYFSLCSISMVICEPLF